MKSDQSSVSSQGHSQTTKPGTSSGSEMLTSSERERLLRVGQMQSETAHAAFKHLRKDNPTT